MATTTTSTAAIMPGEIDEKKLAPLTTIAQKIGISSGFHRQPFIGESCGIQKRSEKLYRGGRPDWKPGDIRPTINRVRKTLDSFEAGARRVDASVVIKSASVNEDGPWILKKPFTIHPKPDASGQPPINPATNKPFQDIPLQANQPIPDELVDQVPAEYRTCIDTETVVKWHQSIFDIDRRFSDFDSTIGQSIHYKQLLGWVMFLFEYDPISEKGTFEFFPPEHWFPDPIKSKIKSMNHVRLDIVRDADEAKRMYPLAAKQIDAAKSYSVKLAAGNYGYNEIYMGGQLFPAPVVTIVCVWMRNQIIPMTLQEALDTNQVTQEAPDAPPSAPEADQGAQVEAPSTGSEDEQPESGNASIDESGEDAGEQSSVGKITHPTTGEDLTASFDQDGNPTTDDEGNLNIHVNHPTKVATVQWLQIDNKVVPGSYMVCPHPEIPVILDKASEIMFRPFADPETVILESPQASINSMHEAMVSHAQQFKGPSGLISKELAGNAAVENGFIDGFSRPGSVRVCDGLGDMDLSKHYVEVQPPSMSAALPQVKESVDRDYELIGDAGVNNGTPPPDVKSGKAILALQAGSQNTNDLKSIHTEDAIRDMVRLKLHAQVNWMSVDKLMTMSREHSREIVEGYILPFSRQILWDFEVLLPTGAGQVAQDRKNQIRQDASILCADGQPLISSKTARVGLDYDDDEEEREITETQEKTADMQAKAQAAAAPQQAPQKQGPNVSISIAYQTLQPEYQSWVMQSVGAPPLSQAHTVDQAQGAAKIQNEAVRTAVDAHAKLNPPKLEKPNGPSPV